MDQDAILDEISHWPVEQRLRLIEEVWDGLPAAAQDGALSDDIRNLLDQRAAALDNEPENLLSWDQIESYVRRPR